MSAIITLDARPANTKEIILIQHRIQDLTKLCGRIAENYQSYVIKEVKHAHLVRSSRFKLKTNSISGRLARIDYTHDDPDNLGNQYRI